MVLMSNLILGYSTFRIKKFFSKMQYMRTILSEYYNHIGWSDRNYYSKLDSMANGISNLKRSTGISNTYVIVYWNWKRNFKSLKVRLLDRY
jgi:hypothetical protein